MSPKISVVVAVYNPGEYLEVLITSLLWQTMPAGEYEVLFVDDGSTDGSGARLDALAVEHAHVRVIHIPNSGWPGRPRNVGLDAAEGRYVYIVDHDDWLPPESLERLYERAERNEADVVLGKEVGHGFGVPLIVFERNVDDAVLGEDPLQGLLTPHKLFRRSMLDEHAIRFPEGKRRLEDHLFVMHAYFHARRISILADYGCYHWTARRGRANATFSRSDPAVYYANMREILDLVDRHTEPGPLRDQLYAHWYTNKTLLKLHGQRFHRTLLTPGPAKLFSEIRSISAERFGPRLAGHLSQRFRLAARVVETGSHELLAAQARLSDELTATAVVSPTALDSQPWRLDIDLRCELQWPEHGPIRFMERDGRWYWDPPGALTDDRELLAADCDVTDELGAANATIAIRHRVSGVQFVQPFPMPIRRDGSTATASGVVEASIDLSTFAVGAPLSDGIWDVGVHVQCCGWTRRADVMLEATLPADERNPTRAYRTAVGKLAIKVTNSPAPPLATAPPLPDAAPPPPPGPPGRPPGTWRRVVRRALPREARSTIRRVFVRFSRRAPAR